MQARDEARRRQRGKTAPVRNRYRAGVISGVLVFGLVVAGGVRLFVDRLGERGEFLVGLAFLIERLLEELGDFRFAECLGEGAGGTVGGDLVMLDALGGADELGVADGVGRVLLDGFLALFHES